jgi:outer membrane protein assembly factor BamB
MHKRLILGILLATLCLPAVDNWPQFRGPGALGVADDPRLPDTWSETENVIWKTEIPGMGWSSPIVWGNRVFVTSAISAGETEKPKKGLYFGGERKKSEDEHRYVVYAIDTNTGKIVWEREAWRGIPPGPRHLKNSYASETPVTDGERVYAYFGNVGIFAYDMNGKEVWKIPVAPARTRFGWGTAASPVLYKGRLIVVNDNDDASYLMAIDAKTGKIIWKVERPGEKSNWSTPFIWEHDGKVEIVTTGTGKNRSYDLDGKLLWEFGGMSSIVIPVPFTQHGLLYLASGYVGDQIRPVFAVKPGGKGELTDSDFAWKLPQAGPYNTSPLVYGDIYYTLLDRGFLTAHDAKTGKELYGKQRIDPAAGAFTASPWAYNGKVFALSEDGDTFVFQAGPEYKLIGKNSLNEFCMSTPAIAGGSLYIRTASKLYRIGKK